MSIFNKNIKTITSWLAAAIFLLALAINVKVTLDDPFMMLSDEAIAQTTTSTSSASGTEILKRIKTYCSCYDNFDRNKWVAMSITECEEYVWQLPMVRTSCVKSVCPPGASCK